MFPQVLLKTQGENQEIVKKILLYVLELAKASPDYDIRDRARMLACLLNSHLEISQKEGTSDVFFYELIKDMFCSNIRSKNFLMNNFRLHLPGSLSQIVLHAAPGYTPLPQPCSLPETCLATLTAKDLFKPEDSSISSYISNESSYDSEVSNSLINEKTRESGSESNSSSQLIHTSDVKENDVSILLSNAALENWLNEQPSLPSTSSSADPSKEKPSARLSIKEIEISVNPKFNLLLDPVNGNGLKVGFYFSSDISKISPSLVCLEVVFENLSLQPLKNISLRDEGSADKDRYIVVNV